MTKHTVSIFSGAEGHLSLAEAAKQSYPKDEFKVHFNLLKTDMIQLYRPIYRYIPAFNKIPFKISKYDRARRIVENYTKLSYQKLITKYLRKQKPEIVISSHFYYNKVLEEINTHNTYKFFNIVSDPRSISPVIPAKHAQNLVFDQKAKKICYDFGVPKNNLHVSGWLVRDEFEKPYEISKVRKSLSLPLDKLTMLIAGGSEGTNHILKILPAILNISKPITVIIACGNNKSLLKTVKALATISSSTYKNAPHIIPLPFTKDIHKYMQASDLVIGKAGPNILFESVATLTPFLAITHIGGQEDGNIDIIKEYNIGIVEENVIKIPGILKKIINSPDYLNSFSKPLQKLALHNKSSSQKLLDLSRKFLS